MINISLGLGPPQPQLRLSVLDVEKAGVSLGPPPCFFDGQDHQSISLSQCHHYLCQVFFLYDCLAGLTYDGDPVSGASFDFRNQVVRLSLKCQEPSFQTDCHFHPPCPKPIFFPSCLYHVCMYLYHFCIFEGYI